MDMVGFEQTSQYIVSSVWVISEVAGEYYSADQSTYIHPLIENSCNVKEAQHRGLTEIPLNLQ